LEPAAPKQKRKKKKKRAATLQTTYEVSKIQIQKRRKNKASKGYDVVEQRKRARQGKTRQRE
jgi:hypothetical protein